MTRMSVREEVFIGHDLVKAVVAIFVVVVLVVVGSWSWLWICVALVGVEAGVDFVCDDVVNIFMAAVIKL